MSQDTRASRQVLIRFLEYFEELPTDPDDIRKQIERFKQVLRERATNELKIPEPGIEAHVDGQISLIYTHYEVMGKMAHQLTVLPPEFTQEEEAMIKKLVEAMADDSCVNDYHDTKPYIDHWGGLSDEDLEELARRIVRELKKKHGSLDVWNGLKFEERVDDIESLSRRCKGTVYAMFKPSLFDECIKDPRGMQIRFIDNQKNNWQKKAEGRKRKLREAENEDQDAGTDSGRGKKRRVIKKKATDLPFDDTEYLMNPMDDYQPPPKPQARKATVPKEPTAPRRIFRGPRFRAMQEKKAKEEASLGGSQSVAPPSAAEASRSGALAGGSTAPIRDAAMACAKGLGVEVLHVRQEYGESEFLAHNRAPTSAAQSGFAGNEDGNGGLEDLMTYYPGNNFATGNIDAAGEQLPRGSAGSYYNDRRGLSGHGTQFVPPNAHVEHDLLGVTTSGEILAPHVEFGMGATDYGINIPATGQQQAFTTTYFEDTYQAPDRNPQTPIVHDSSTISGPPFHVHGGDIFANYYQTVGGSYQAADSSAQAPLLYWAAKPGDPNRGTPQATGSNSQAPVSYSNEEPLSGPLYDYDFGVGNLLGDTPLPQEFSSGRAVGRATGAVHETNPVAADNAAHPVSYFKINSSLPDGGQEAAGGNHGTSNQEAGSTIQTLDALGTGPAAVVQYHPHASTTPGTPGTLPWDVKWDAESPWDDAADFGEEVKIEPLPPTCSITPTPRPRFDHGEEIKFFGTCGTLEKLESSSTKPA